jgi:uncharacterized protein
LDLIRNYPKTQFIVGHAGIFQYREVISLFGGYKNAFVDTSFQSPSRIRDLLNAFGTDRVLFGSDWPWGDRRTNIVSVKKACRGDQGLEQAIYHDNAARLMRV